MRSNRLAAVTGTGRFRNHFVLSPTLCGQVYVVERHPVFVVRSVGWHLAERHHGDDDAAGGDGCGSYLDHHVEPCRTVRPASTGVVVMSLRGCSLLQEAADDMGPWGYILGAVQRAGPTLNLVLTKQRIQARLQSTTFQVWSPHNLLPALWRTEPPLRRSCSDCRLRDHPHPSEDPNRTWCAGGEAPGPEQSIPGCG